jgi:hypothetical protein
MTASTATARVTHRGHVREVREGDEVRLGRSATCDVQVGLADDDGTPEDLGVSRRAATVSVRDGRVWVRNDSTSQPVYLVPDTGSTRVLEGLDEVASLPTDRVTVQFRGRIRTHDVVVELDGPDRRAVIGSASATGRETQYLLEFSRAERRILTALCEPLLVDRGDKARPASYAQAASRVFLSRSRVENCASDLVRKFASAGVPNLEGPEAKDNLCRYAVRSGSITRADLELLDE